MKVTTPRCGPVVWVQSVSEKVLEKVLRRVHGSARLEIWRVPRWRPCQGGTENAELGRRYRFEGLVKSKLQLGEVSSSVEFRANGVAKRRRRSFPLKLWTACFERGPVVWIGCRIRKGCCKTRQSSET